MSQILTKGFELHSSEPLDVSKHMFLAAKCPNCQKLIRFTLSGIYSTGWNLRTFYCKCCQQTHAITMFFEVTESKGERIAFLNLTNSLWRLLGSRMLHRAHSHPALRISMDDPAKMLGYSNKGLSKFLRKFIVIFKSHIYRTVWEKELHQIERESLATIEGQLDLIQSTLKGIE